MDKIISRSRQAAAWILAAPKGKRRTQEQAARKFGISQGTVSIALKRHVARSVRPDGRRK